MDTKTLDMISMRLKDLEQTQQIDSSKEVNQIKEYSESINDLITGHFETISSSNHKQQVNSMDEIIQILQKEYFQVQQQNIKQKNQQISIKQEKDQVLQETNILNQQNGTYKKFCQDMNKKIQEVQKYNNQYESDEKNKRNDMEKQFQESIKEIVDKINEQEEEVNVLIKQNGELGQEVKEKIKEYESSKDSLNQKLEQEDSNSTKKNQEFIDQLQSFEEGAKEAFSLKRSIEMKKNAVQEHKMKIAFYLEKTKDFEDSLESTANMLDKFENEIKKSGCKYRVQLNNQQKVQGKLNNINNAYIVLLQKSEEMKKKVKELNEQKKEESENVKKIQEQIKIVNRQIEESKQ